jgi:hypothetical protein
MQQRRIYTMYSGLARIEDEMASGNPIGDRMSLIKRLDELEERASRLSLPQPYLPLLYALKAHLRMVRQQISR